MSGSCTRGIVGHMVDREYPVESSWGAGNGTLQRILDFRIGTFVVREHTGDCGSWANVMPLCSVPTLFTPRYLLCPLSATLDTNIQDMNTQPYF